jgi:(p)ppGpp synthase/HD superfamily hydrolase
MPKDNYLKKAELEELLSDKLNPEDISKIIGAYEMAEEAQEGELDPAGEPKFHHNTHVCRIVLNELSITEPDILITALLHNILKKSSEISLSIIDYNFGSSVAYLVQLICDDDAERRGDKQQTINPDTIDDDALIVILSDFLDILRTFDTSKLLNPFVYINHIKQRYFATAQNRSNEKIRYLITELQKEFNKIID